MNMKLDELAAEYIGTKMNVTLEDFMANKIEALEEKLRVATEALENIQYLDEGDDYESIGRATEDAVKDIVKPALAKIKDRPLKGADGTTDEDRKRAIDYVCDKKGW